MVRIPYKGYRHPRPEVAHWYGSNNTVLYTHNYYEAIKRWATCLGAIDRSHPDDSGSSAASFAKTERGPNAI
jgi:hypothetical protein